MFLSSSCLLQHQAIGLGHSWSHRALGQDEMHLTASTCRSLTVGPQRGDRVNLVLDFIAMFAVPFCAR